MLIGPESFLRACDINLACKPTVTSPICPSSSALGTNAATESITITSKAAVSSNFWRISSACSPESGCETNKSSALHPRFLAYSGSNAFSASINAAFPPFFWHSATICKARVVFPEDSGPNTSIILPFGTPPTPKAISSERHPVEIASTSRLAVPPNLIMDPSPYSLLISNWTASNALSTFFAITTFL